MLNYKRWDIWTLNNKQINLNEIRRRSWIVTTETMPGILNHYSCFASQQD